MGAAAARTQQAPSCALYLCMSPGRWPVKAGARHCTRVHTGLVKEFEESALALPGRHMREGPVPQHFRVLPQLHPPDCQLAVCSPVTT